MLIGDLQESAGVVNVEWHHVRRLDLRRTDLLGDVAPDQVFTDGVLKRAAQATRSFSATSSPHRPQSIPTPGDYGRRGM
jgi:hypothetical protein